jgi:hypothetical protein
MSVVEISRPSCVQFSAENPVLRRESGRSVLNGVRRSAQQATLRFEKAAENFEGRPEFFLMLGNRDLREVRLQIQENVLQSVSLLREYMLDKLRQRSGGLSDAKFDQISHSN